MPGANMSRSPLTYFDIINKLKALPINQSEFRRVVEEILAIDLSDLAENTFKTGLLSTLLSSAKAALTRYPFDNDAERKEYEVFFVGVETIDPVAPPIEPEESDQKRSQKVDSREQTSYS